MPSTAQPSKARQDLDERQLTESFDPGEFFSALLKQIYIDQQYVPRIIHVPVDFEDREALEELLTEQGRARRPSARVHILMPQRGQKKALLDLVGTTPSSFDQRFRVMKPTAKAIQEALQDALGLARAPAAHRVLRHLAHPGHRQSGQHGGVGRRPDEEVRLPQVHHPRRDRQRRFRHHARSGDAALHAPCRKRTSRCPAWC